jgi:hypothetical protein
VTEFAIFRFICKRVSHFSRNSFAFSASPSYMNQGRFMKSLFKLLEDRRRNAEQFFSGSWQADAGAAPPIETALGIAENLAQHDLFQVELSQCSFPIISNEFHLERHLPFLRRNHPCLTKFISA